MKNKSAGTRSGSPSPDPAALQRKSILSINFWTIIKYFFWFEPLKAVLRTDHIVVMEEHDENKNYS